MSTVCPEGHTSADPDYCDHCGARMNPDPEPIAATPPPATPSSAKRVDAAVELAPCPECQTPRLDAGRFCEGCGHDFDAPVGAVMSTWEAVIMADRLHFARSAPESAAFPEDAGERIVALTTDRVAIGRTRATGDAAPEIDLAQPPEDSAVSHSHAVLERQGDGAYAVVDHGSTNGTSINNDPNPIARDVPVTLGDGDEIHIGMWTTILVRRTDEAATDD